MPYWAEARSWAKDHTKTFTPFKAGPSILATLAQWRLFNLQPMMRALVSAGTLIGSYLLLYLLEYAWNLFVKAPRAIYQENQGKLTGLRERLAVAERPKRPAAESARLQQIESTLDQCGYRGMAVTFLRLLAERPEYEWGDFRAKLEGAGVPHDLFGVLLPALERGHLVLRIPPSAMRPFNALQINPEYKSLLLEVLHNE